VWGECWSPDDTTSASIATRFRRGAQVGTGTIELRSWSSSMHLSSFGGRIRRLRMDHGITLRDFARRLEVSPTYISQIEQGNFKPPAEPVVVSMARILGQDSDELLLVSTGTIFSSSIVLPV
jgi:DNA-binding XRE family transcriptional regulator